MRMRGSDFNLRSLGPLRRRGVPFWKEAILVLLLSSLGVLAADAMVRVQVNNASELPGVMGPICKGSKAR